MPDDNDDDQTDDTPEVDLVPRSHIRDLEAKAKLTDDQAARITALERENAFAKALGSAVTEPRMDYFLRGYDGPLEVDAIRAEAMAKGFLADPSSPSTHQSLDAAGRLAAASQGAGEPLPPDLHEAVLKAETPDEILDILEAAGVPTTRSMQ